MSYIIIIKFLYNAALVYGTVDPIDNKVKRSLNIFRLS